LGEKFNLVVTPIPPPLGDIKVLSETTTPRAFWTPK
jgi:hypothetical protein